MNDLPIELHPEARKLQEEIALLREELAARFAELHALEHLGRPNLLAIYQVKLGPWELRLIQAQSDCARLKRKTECVQACLNRDQTPDLSAIDTALDLEFLAWQQHVSESAQKIKAAQFRLGQLLEPGQDTDLKKLYRALVKKLHPDVNPELAGSLRDLWLQALDAYESGDIQKLKALLLLAETPGGHSPATPGSMEALRAEHERLRRHVLSMFGRLAEINAQPPFCHRRQWEDDAWVGQRRLELDALTAAAHERAQALETHLAALLLAHGPRKTFGLN